MLVFLLAVQLLALIAASNEADSKRSGGLFVGQISTVESADAADRASFTWLGSKPGKRLAGLLLLFHGCKGSDRKWFATPEGQRIVGEAQSVGLVTLAFRAHSVAAAAAADGKQCWLDFAPVRRRNVDLVAVRASLSAFVAQHHLQALPRFALGASSGGSFVSLLARYERLDAVAIMIAPGVPAFVNPQLGAVFPDRVCFIYMVEDHVWASPEAIYDTRQRAQAQWPSSSWLEVAIRPKKS